MCRFCVLADDHNERKTLNCRVEYKKEILQPVLSRLARRHGQADLLEGLLNKDEPLVIPMGVSQFEVKLRQVGKCVFSSFVLAEEIICFGCIKNFAMNGCFLIYNSVPVAENSGKSGMSNDPRSATEIGKRIELGAGREIER